MTNKRSGLWSSCLRLSAVTHLCKRVTISLLYWESSQSPWAYLSEWCELLWAQTAVIIQQWPWIKRNTKSAVRGLKPSVWNEKERKWKWEKGVGYPQRKCFWLGRCQTATAGKRRPDRSKRASNGLCAAAVTKTREARSQTPCRSGTRYPRYIWTPSSHSFWWSAAHIPAGCLPVKMIFTIIYCNISSQWCSRFLSLVRVNVQILNHSFWYSNVCSDYNVNFDAKLRKTMNLHTI